MGAGGHGGHSLAKGTFFSTDLVYSQVARPYLESQVVYREEVP